MSDLAVALAAPHGRLDGALAGEILAGGRRLARQHIVDDTLHHDLAAVDARAGTHLDDVVGGANGVLVMLHHDDGVADVAQAFEGRDHLHVVLRVQADARLVEHVEHSHQARTDLGGQAYALRLAAGERAGAAIEAEIIEPDAEQQLQAAADFAQHLAAGIGAAARRCDGAEELVQLVEVKLAHVVDRLAVDGEQQPGGAHARAFAVRAGVLHHDFVEPRFHSGAGFAALAVAAVVPFDAPRDAAEADRFALRVLPFGLRVGGHAHHDFPVLEPFEDRVPHGLRQLFPRRVEREVEGFGEAVHHAPVPGVGVVLEGLAHEAAADDAAPRVGDEQFRVRQLVDPESAAGAAGALRVVEHEVLGLYVAVHEVLRLAAQAAIETLRLRLARAFDNLHLEQAVADQQRGGDPRLDRLFVFAAHHEAVHDGVHVLDLGFVDFDFGGDVHRLAVDDQNAAAFLAYFGEDEIELFAVLLEDRRAQLDLGALGQREDGFEDLARRTAGGQLAGARAVRHADGGVEKIEVAGDVGHGADGGARVVGDGLLLDGDDGRQAVHEIHVGLGHLRDEALGVGGERLHVTPLAFGIDGVEGEAGFARARQSGDHNQLVARNLHADVLEVVDARAVHGDGGARRRLDGLRTHRALLPGGRTRVPARRHCSSWSVEPASRPWRSGRGRTGTRTRWSLLRH